MNALAIRLDERRRFSAQLAGLQEGLDSALRLSVKKKEPLTGL